MVAGCLRPESHPLEPEVQKLAITALVGLALLFPVFNEVQATSLEALRDADHKAKFQDFIKDWDDIPEDEKLSYWDGRNKPPGADGDFDSDRVDDDARFGRPDGSGDADGGAPDRDGDGTPDASDPDPDDPRVSERGRERIVEEVLWTFEGAGAFAEATETIGSRQQNYEQVNVSYSYDQFSGNFDFTLRADEQTVWPFRSQQFAPYTIQDGDSGSEEIPLDNGVELVMAYTYDPLGEPDHFTITITGTYIVYEPIE